MDLGIAGRRAAVAAASRGLGYATAAALAEEGVHVAICGRDEGSVNEATARIGRNCVGLMADVSTVDGARGFVADAGDALGGVDILVANAGGPPAGSFASVDDIEAYAKAFELNCLSSIAMCRATVPAMQAAGWGRVLAITSIAVRQPIPTLILSNTARAGLTGFLKTLAREVAGDGVTVNSLQPGFHATERMQALHEDPSALGSGVPAGVIGDPADFGRIAAFVCSEAAGYVTGAAIPVDGGAKRGAPVTAAAGGCRHVSVLTFRDGTSAAEIVAVAEALAALPGEIGVIRDYRVGPDLGIDDGNCQFVVVADFASPADYAVYRDHPAHRAVLADVIRPILASRAAAQYTL